MTTPIITALFYGGDFEKARDFLQTEGYIPTMLSKSRFKRRLYRLEPMFHIHVMVTESGPPVEFFLSPGSYSDTSAYGWYRFDLPQQSWVTGDKAYTDYVIEDVLNEAGLRMRTIRKANSKRP
jgi:hypothetical protein